MAAAELVEFSPRYSWSLQYLATVAFSSIAGLVPVTAIGSAAAWSLHSR